MMFQRCQKALLCIKGLSLPAIVATVKTCSTFRTSSSITVKTTNTAKAYLLE